MSGLRTARMPACPATPGRLFKRSGLLGGGLLLAAVLAAGASRADEGSPADPGVAPAAAGNGAAPMAEGEQRVVDLNEQGSRLYAAGDYRRAVELFIEAYAVGQDPNLLFNIASCYEGLGDIEAAIEKYHDFLDAPTADVEGRPRAERAIERLRLEAAAPVVVEPPPAPAPAPAPPVAAPVDSGGGDPAWVPWVGLGGGAALVALGTTFYLMGASDHAKVTDAGGYDDPNAVVAMTRSEADDLVRSGNTKKQIGVLTASAGGALAAGYLVWWWLHRPDAADAADAPEAASIDFGVSATTARVVWSGAF
jgi:hypothetical protein